MSVNTDRIARVARERFGYERLRPGQEPAIQAVLEGRDTLVVMPTGSGKSAIYQIAGVMLPRMTIVVSPLIALQRDQVGAIAKLGVAEAAEVNVTVGAEERREAFEEVEERKMEYLFLAPEQFNNEEVLDQLRAAKPSLFVVDEAHCISEWGHDFRPEYLRLGTVIESLGRPTVLALTATASPPVREEIIERLGMREPLVVARGFDRPNIWLGVERFHDVATKKRALLKRVEQAEKPGIVYVATRKHAEDIAAALRKRGVKAAHYHAGMKASERTQAQQAFMMDGEVEVIVATTAFGMGVDKPNVRFVFHYEISESVDAYYQEIGRAGRDGKPAKAILFYRPQDLGIRHFFASGGQISADEVQRVAEVVHAHEGPVDLRTLQQETGLSETKLAAALSRLEETGVIALRAAGEVIAVEPHGNLGEAAEEAFEAQERYHQFERSRVEMMQGYAEVQDCRREYLLNYFGEEYPEPCGFCDNCDAGIVVLENESREPFPANSRVVHRTWGEGMVLRYEGDKMVVLFDKVGYKTLSIDIVTQRGLLKAAG